jgi:hypothetical protein
MVPTLQCGLVRSNFFLAILDPLYSSAHNQIRTGDPVLTKNVLFQLSYVGTIS